tara:strand:+ start:397 stop:1317 length:921 start_codon:yes stop_codon:yes gene_type:complete
MAAPEPPVDAVLELGAQKLGMPAGRLSRGVNQQLFWKVVVVFDIHEPRGKRGGQAPHFTAVYLCAPDHHGYPIQAPPQRALIPGTLVELIATVVADFQDRELREPLVQTESGALRVQDDGEVLTLRRRVDEVLRPAGFRWASTDGMGRGIMANVHCTGGLPYGVPDSNNEVSYDKVKLITNLAPIAANRALHYVLLMKYESINANHLECAGLAKRIGEASSLVTCGKDLEGIHGVGPARAGIVDRALHLLRDTAFPGAGQTLQDPSATVTGGKRKLPPAEQMARAAESRQAKAQAGSSKEDAIECD